MPTYMVSDATSDLEEGTYPAIIDSIDYEDPNPDSLYNTERGQYLVNWKFFDLVGDDGSDLDISKRQYVNDPKSLTENSGLYQLFSTVLCNGEPLDPAVAWDPNRLQGKKAMVTWGSYMGKDANGKPKKKQKITMVSPFKQKSSGIRRKAVSEPIDPDAALDDI